MLVDVVLEGFGEEIRANDNDVVAGDSVGGSGVGGGDVAADGAPSDHAEEGEQHRADDYDARQDFGAREVDGAGEEEARHRDGSGDGEDFAARGIHLKTGIEAVAVAVHDDEGGVQ